MLRRLSLPAVLVCAIVVLSACGGGGGGGGSASKDPSAKLFVDNCASCHTLKAAGTTGRTGPDLDTLQPSVEAAERQITNGGGGMPAFKSHFKATEIHALATWINEVAGKE